MADEHTSAVASHDAASDPFASLDASTAALHNVDATILSRIARITRTIPELLECHRVTGNSSYILKVVAASVSDLERIIDKLSPLAATSTSLVLSTVVSDRPLSPRPGASTDESDPA